MTFLMALTFLVVGFLCIQRPERIAEWMAGLLIHGAHRSAEDVAWLKGRGMMFFIRFIGFLALVNVVMLLYTWGQY